LKPERIDNKNKKKTDKLEIAGVAPPPPPPPSRVYYDPTHNFMI
jgi:hypothetical protein